MEKLSSIEKETNSYLATIINNSPTNSPIDSHIDRALQQDDQILQHQQSKTSASNGLEDEDEEIMSQVALNESLKEGERATEYLRSKNRIGDSKQIY